MNTRLLSSVSTLALVGLLTACGPSTEGLSPESSKTPKGNPNSAVVLTEFADLQCPACRAAHEQINPVILEEYGDRIAFEFKHFPIRAIHRYALEAAYAAECAADQGKFWEFVDLDFEKQDEMSMEALEAWGKELGLDMDLYNRCRETEIKKEAILAEYNTGRDKGVTGTPAFFVNGERVETGLDEIRKALDAALANAAARL